MRRKAPGGAALGGILRAVKTVFQKLLAQADIRIGGSRPWDIEVVDPRFYRRVLWDGPFAFGESYVDGGWTCPALDEMFARALAADLPRVFAWHPRTVARYLGQKLFNLQRGRRSQRVATEHYDLSPELFMSFLDSANQYTCGYWKDLPGIPANLDRAQQAKMDLICRKLGLKPGMTLLDMGCGWGGFARFAAEKYGARVTGITNSGEQALRARTSCKGLAVDIRVQDYRETRGAFDRIVCAGMIEHVGPKNYARFMRTMVACLKDDGLFLLHSITTRRRGPNLVDSELAWIGKYIFSNSAIPAISQLVDATEGRFVVEDVHNFGADYDLTLMAWHSRFNENLPALRRAFPQYDERFARRWNFYLLGCAGCFRCRKYDLSQLVLSKTGVPGGYLSLR